MCPLPARTAPTPQPAAPVRTASPGIPPVTAAHVRRDADMIDSACSDAGGWA